MFENTSGITEFMKFLIQNSKFLINNTPHHRIAHPIAQEQ